MVAQQPSYFILGKDEFEGVQIYDVIQDNRNNYWFATDRGFYKYDGYNFVSVEVPKMKGQAAFGFVKNKSGIIFAYNLNHQIIKIENAIGSIFYELSESEKAPDIYLSITSENLLLVLTKSAILFTESGKKLAAKTFPGNYYGFPFQLKNGITISHVLGKDSLLVFKNGESRFKKMEHKANINGLLKFFRHGVNTFAVNLSDKSVYLFNESTFSLKKCEFGFSLPEKEFFRFYNENNELWVAGTVSGVRRFNPSAGSLESPLLYNEFLISDVYRDLEGNLLLCTFNHGVLVIPDLEIPDVLDLDDNTDPVSIVYDNNLGVLMGTLNGKLIRYHKQATEELSSDGSRPVQVVFNHLSCEHIVYDDGSIKALNKETGKIQVVHKGSLKDAVMGDSGRVYLALNLGVAELKFDKNDNISITNLDKLKIRTNAIAFDNTNEKLYASTANGLLRLTKDGKINLLKVNGEQIFPNDIAFSEGKLFATTINNGILVFVNDNYSKTIQPEVKISASQILKFKIVKNNFYLNTSTGFFVMDQTGKIIFQLNKAHGFSTNRIFDFDVSGEYLWLAHSKGVQQIRMDLLEEKIPQPIIRFTNIEINDAINVSTTHDGDFDYSQRKFVFTLSSPTLKHKENIQYHYKLEGYDQVWYAAPYLSNKIVYNALQPGNYILKVKASNNGIFSNEIRYKFTIGSPFYQKAWFIVLMCSLFVLITFLFYRRQLLKQRRKAELLNEINLSRLAAIQSQMNPHFIFNSLNAIQDLVLKGDVENSYTFITRFSDLIRRTLNYSDKDFIEFEEEIKLLELYLSLEKLRFKSSLEYTIEKGNIEDIMIPPMLIQPFIENALLHGLLHKEGLKELIITFKQESQLICIIEDNGVGREKAREIKLRQGANHESFSGQAIKKRLEILSQQFKEEVGVVVEDLPIGTRVILKIPVKYKF